MDEDASQSDQDSLSLLEDVPAWQSRGAAEIPSAADSGTQTEIKEIKKEKNLSQQNQNQNRSSTPHSLNPDAGASSGELEILQTSCLLCLFLLFRLFFNLVYR